MASPLLELEPAIRLGVFFGAFSLMAVWEVLAPRRAQALLRRSRWPGNISMVFLNTLLLRVLMPVAAIDLALNAENAHWGLFNLLQLPSWLAIVLAVIALDLAIYLQHVMFHAVPLLWRLHRMHHADQGFDVTTGSRFHSLEIILSMLIKLLLIAALGPPAVAVLIFEVLLNALAMFNHANIALPLALDRWLRYGIVTPDMHRVHHSIYPDETNSNFGFNLSLWDRCLGTYRAQPRDGHQGMTIGINAFRTPRDQRLDQMLIQPLRQQTGNYPINRSPAADD